MSGVLDRIASGDGTAVQDCMDQYGGLVWTLARRMCSTDADAEDAVQEIFIDLWKNAAKFDANKSAEKTFIAMLARRRLIDRWRKTQRRPQYDPLPETGPEPGVDTRSAIEAGADAAVAGRALRELRPDQQRVLALSIYYGMSHREISDAMEIPLGTVKSHIARGLVTVRKAMEIAGGAGEGTGK